MDCPITQHEQSETTQMPSCPLSVGWREWEETARHASTACGWSCQHFPMVSDWFRQTDKQTKTETEREIKQHVQKHYTQVDPGLDQKW